MFAANRYPFGSPPFAKTGFAPSKIKGLSSWYKADAQAYTDGAIQFTASDKAYLSIADASQTGLDPLTGDYSYSFWVNPTTITAEQMLVTKILTSPNGNQIYISNPNGEITVTMADGAYAAGTSASGVLSAGTWTNLTVVANRSGNLYVYKNGNTASPVITVNISARTGSINNEVPFIVGGRGDGRYFNGSMDSLGFWNRALTAAEIASLYNSGNGRMYADLSTTEKVSMVSWWGFNEEGGTRYDAHGTNHLTQVFANIIDNTSSLGTELVTNGTDFTGGPPPTGWTAGNNAVLTAEAGGQAGDCLKVLNNVSNYGYAYQSFTTVANQNYTASIYYKDGNAGSILGIGVAAGGTTIFQEGLTNANWTQKNVNFKATGTTTVISLFCNSGGDTDYTLFDTVSLKALTQTNLNGGFESLGAGETLGSELVLNPSFTTLGGGGADIWANWSESAGTGAIANETTDFKTTPNAAKLTGGAGNDTIATQDVTVSAGARYKLTFWTHGDGTYAGQYRIYDLIGSANIVAPTSTGVTGASYVQVTQYFTTPANCTSIRFYIYAPSTNTGIAYFDDVSLKQVTAYAPFLNWTTIEPNTATVAVSTTSYSGTYAAALTLGSSYCSIRQSILTTKHKYKAIVYAKASTGTPNMYLYFGTVAVGVPITTTYAAYTVYATTDATDFSPTILNAYTLYLDDVAVTATEIPSAAGIAAGLAIDGNLCASFNGSTQYLTIDDNASLRIGAGSFTLAGWFNLNSFKGYGGLVAKTTGGTAAGTEYAIRSGATGTNFMFEIGDGSATTKSAGSAAVSVNTWYFVVAWLDAAAQTINISINNGTPVSTSITGYTPQTLATSLQFASYGKGYLIDGRLDGWMLLKRTLTASEITALYNNGKGVKYAGLPSTVSSDATLSFWNLDEYSVGTSNVTRLDSVTTSANNLTSAGNTPSGQGVNYYEGTVAKWLDQSGNSKTIVQTTLGSRLMYVTNAQNSKPVLRGDGLTKCLSNAADLIGTGSVTVFAVIKLRSFGGATLARIIDNSKFLFYLDAATGGKLVCISDGATSAYSANSSIVINTAYIVSVTRTAAGVINFYINGVASGTANQSTGTPVAGATTYIGNNASSNRGLDGDIDEIGIVSRILTPSEINKLTKALGIKWGITVTV